MYRYLVVLTQQQSTCKGMHPPTFRTETGPLQPCHQHTALPAVFSLGMRHRWFGWELYLRQWPDFLFYISGGSRNENENSPSCNFLSIFFPTPYCKIRLWMRRRILYEIGRASCRG